jgi:hypothetical protein|tara:strand:+ start:136 stop:420 length:285 start_codon:yes stop_codon:yes gene_type:complete
VVRRLPIESVELYAPTRTLSRILRPSCANGTVTGVPAISNIVNIEPIYVEYLCLTSSVVRLGNDIDAIIPPKSIIACGCDGTGKLSIGVVPVVV